MVQPNSKISRAFPTTPTVNALLPSTKGSEKERKQLSTKAHDSTKSALDQKLQKKKQRETQGQHEDIIDHWRLGHDEPPPEDEKSWRQSLFETGSSESNFFHIVATQHKGKIPKMGRDWLERLALESPSLLTKENEYRSFAIEQGANKLPGLVFLISDLVIPDSTRKALEASAGHEAPCGHEPCPLWGVSPALRQFRSLKETIPLANVAARAIDASAPSNNPDTQSEDQAAETSPQCLHDQVSVGDLLKRERNLRNALKQALANGRAHEILKYLLYENRFDPDSDNPQIVEIKSFQNILNLCPDNTFIKEDSEGYTLLQSTVNLFDKSLIKYELQYDVIGALVQRSPASMFFEAKTNVYRRLDEVGKRIQREGKDWIDKVRNLIKGECIRYKEDIPDAELQAKKRKLLYGHCENEKKLSLNLTGESAIIDDVYVKMIIQKSGLQLETADGAEPYRSKRKQSPPLDSTGPPTAFPDPYVGFFDWLWNNCEVRKIMTLDIDDDGPEPHTNAGIRAGLSTGERDFGIEVWKWKKYDMCVDTIVKVAPKVRELHLFSRGNTAVLRGWSCRSGLAKLTELEKLFVEIYPTNEKDEQDCRAYAEEFMSKVTKHCLRLDRNSVIIGIYGKSSGGQSVNLLADPAVSGGVGQTLSLGRPKRDEWVKELRAYTEFITNLGMDMPDGVSEVPKSKLPSKLGDLEGAQWGWPFRADDQEYFVGPCKHGTEMAICVRDICPVAELYIARLDDSGTLEPNQKFTIKSCVEALRDEDKIAFEKLVKGAVDGHKAVLFGSLPDLGPNADASSYSPVGLHGVIKISSATRSGDVASDNLHQRSDFLLPGDEIEDSNGESARGSSFATAYAAGLASLVLYPFRVLNLRDPESSHARKAPLVAKTSAGMKLVFGHLAPETGSARNNIGRFVRPFQKLSPKGHKGTGEDSLRRLSEIVHDLVSDEDIQEVFPGGVPFD
ncbi:hypothetical protein B0H63DRAFT_544419 [Podospora didyma]|uniref:Peptidase S8/S53 domain-containing protein n=1 Tax=Podospora didyma TaxID=330526 RepID=A0AAE0NR33_9PEZI|nr:hypothetical protein B0H63DRAFT_544419 [Podospora didyma]